MSNPAARRPGIDDVDDLCRLPAAARHLDCRIHLSGAASDLRELVDLAGVGDVLVDCPAEAAVQQADTAPLTRTTQPESRATVRQDNPTGGGLR